MGLRQKRKLLISLAIGGLALVVVVGYLLFNKTLSGRVPKNGFYPVQANSYFAFTSDESWVIHLGLFFVNNNSFANNMADEYSEFQLLTSEGEALDFDIDADSLEKFLDSANHFPTATNVIEGVIEVNLPNFKRGLRTITSLKYKNPKGIYEVKSLGKITVEGIEGWDYVQASTRRLFWTSFIQPTFDRVEWTFENNIKDPVSVVAVEMPNCDINVAGTYPQELLPLTVSEFSFNVDLPQEEPLVPVIYALKPKYKYTLNGEIGWGVFGGAQVERFLSNDLDINEYLFSREQ